MMRMWANSLNFPASNLDGPAIARRLLTNPPLDSPLLRLRLSRSTPSFFHLPIPVVIKMPATASRAVLRQSQFLTRRTAVRHASSTSETASKATESASSSASKAQDGLSRVSSSAGPAISSAASGLGNTLKRAGGRTGKVVTFVECK